jgi:predicted alpha/beta-fold hydrolase
MNKELANSGLGAAIAALIVIFAPLGLEAEMTAVAQGAMTVIARYLVAYLPKPAGWKDAKQ